MTLFDNLINKASDAAHSTAEQVELAQRRRQLEGEIAAQEARIASNMRVVGQVALSGGPQFVPEPVRGAIAAVHQWRSEIHGLEDELARLTHPASPPPCTPGPSPA